MRQPPPPTIADALVSRPTTFMVGAHSVVVAKMPASWRWTVTVDTRSSTRPSSPRSTPGKPASATRTAWIGSPPRSRRADRAPALAPPAASIADSWRPPPPLEWSARPPAGILSRMPRFPARSPPACPTWARPSSRSCRGSRRSTGRSTSRRATPSSRRRRSSTTSSRGTCGRERTSTRPWPGSSPSARRSPRRSSRSTARGTTPSTRSPSPRAGRRRSSPPSPRWCARATR